ncbi:MAG: tRNA (N(6)-L-threonylcarbamoyladenosine(37)-C(2))-methylthiotransferase MtaB [Candidatus Omnitrophica bacterium]|nr:tRNA (N(6)-L-threonylcarbamoyladenosine(37)-C(2))-methylthiotransferase MtaB [Candidatus Omnitrophota bacterium]
MKFCIKTLGCKVNQYEEQVLRENLCRMGFEESSEKESDIAIINSCTVTAQADSKTRRLIRKLKRENEKLKIFVTGCYAVFDEDIKKIEALPEVYKVIPGKDKMKLPAICSVLFLAAEKSEKIKEEIEGFSSHSRAFLKIQDGCGHKCSYCKVSLVRGPSRSRDEHAVINELILLNKKGYNEIVLTGICLGAWTGSNSMTFSDLLRKIDNLDGNFRVRLSSIEPDYINDALIETLFSSHKICRHLHVPLQSGSDKILKLMGRRYCTKDFELLVKKLRRKMPLMGITMDVIVGFPGETETDFDETINFIDKIKPSRVHVFKYSDRKGTASFLFKDKVPVEVAKRRVEKLMERAKLWEKEFSKKFVGRQIEVLIEKQTNADYSEGYTGEYVKVKLRGLAVRQGDIVSVKCQNS